MLDFTLVSPLQQSVQDEPISSEKLSRTPEPPGMRQPNKNRVAAVNRLLQNNLPLGIGVEPAKPNKEEGISGKVHNITTNVIPSSHPVPHLIQNSNSIQNSHQQLSRSVDRQSAPTLWGPHSVGYNKYTAGLIGQHENGNRTASQQHKQQINRSVEGRDRSREQRQYLHPQQHSIPNNSQKQFLVKPQTILQSPPHRILIQPRQQIHPNQLAMHKLSAQSPTTLLTQSHPVQRPWLVPHQPTNQQREPSNPESDGYPKKLASLSRKIDEIVGINESLEAKIQTMRNSIEEKDSENLRLRRKVEELQGKLKGFKREAQDIEQSNVDYKRRLDEETTKVRAKYEQSTAKLQNQLSEVRKVCTHLEGNVRKLQNQCKAKDKQIQKYKEFVAQMVLYEVMQQSGFDNIRKQ